MGPNNHVLVGDEYRTNPFAAARGKKAAMRPLAKLLCTLVYIFCHFLAQLSRMLT